MQILCYFSNQQFGHAFSISLSTEEYQVLYQYLTKPNIVITSHNLLIIFIIKCSY